MAHIRPFRAYRPIPGMAAQVASRPYDVLDTQEARVEAHDNPLSFYHAVKPEIQFPAGHNIYAPEVYEAGKAFFNRLVSQGVMIRDAQPCYYLYRQVMDGRSQTGLVAAASVEDYFSGVIKIHEYTRPEKEEDRRRHVRVSGLNYEPVFFSYPAVAELDTVLAPFADTEPLSDFEAADGVRHTVWAIADPEAIASITRLFADKVPNTYVADGHHRTAAAAWVGRERMEANPAHTGQEPYHFFMAVHFPDRDLRVLDYNRLVKDLNGHSATGFLEALTSSFEVGPPQHQPVKPAAPRQFSLYLEGAWRLLKAHPDTFDPSDPISDLDITLLTRHLLEPVLGISDQRTDPRIDFVGGIRGLSELARRVDSGEMAAALALYPVSMPQLMAVADAGQVMPPKSTWFEPKLRSGLLVYAIDED